MRAYIGTYTKKDSEGIYLVEFDNNALPTVKNVAKIENPTYLNFSSDKRYLYSVSKKNGEGAVTSFKILNDASLKELTSVSKIGNPPCYLEVSHNDKYLLSANYHTSTIDSYSIKNGELEKLLSTDIHHGKSVHPRQEKPHVHFSGFTPDGKYAVSCDLGTDEITFYTLPDGILTKQNTVKVNPGSGPRHIVFDSEQKHAFVMTELSSEIIAFDYENGNLDNPVYYPTLPEEFNLENKGSAIKISNDNKFIYISNRGQDSIVVFKNNSGNLEHIQTISSFGENPRDFNLNQEGTIAIATNETSDNITIFSVDKNLGTLTILAKDIHVPEPVCVQFLD